MNVPIVGEFSLHFSGGSSVWIGIVMIRANWVESVGCFADRCYSLADLRGNFRFVGWICAN